MVRTACVVGSRRCVRSATGPRSPRAEPPLLGAIPHTCAICDRCAGNTWCLLSFFDEPEDFSPRKTTGTAPRRTGGGGGGPRRPSSGDVVRRRQIFAGIGAVVLLVVLSPGSRGAPSIR